MGLSIGQREAAEQEADRVDRAASQSSSTIEAVSSAMGDVHVPKSKRSQRVVTVKDLLIDFGGEETGEGSTGNNASVGLKGESVAIGVGADGPATEAPSVLPLTPSLSNRPSQYLQNPVGDATKWLHNQQLPSVILKHEKPEHRIMLWFKAQGKSNREIAQLLGYGDAQVSQITRQSWFVESLREVLEETGADLVQRMLKGTAVDCIVTLVDIRDNAKQPGSTRAAAANSLLDRFLGKPKQEISVERKESPTQKAASIDASLESLQERQRELEAQLASPRSKN